MKNSAQPYYKAGDSVIAQGKEVGSTSFVPLQVNHETWTRGEPQPKACRDFIWAILFYVHLGTIGLITAKYVPLMAEDLAEGYASGSYNNDYDNGRRLRLLSSRWLEESGQQQHQDQFRMEALWFTLTVSGIVGCAFSTLAMICMMRFAQGLIKIALFFNVLVTFAMTILAFSWGSTAVTLIFIFFFIFSLYYAYIVWNRIPFAASNLITAVTAVRANMGLAFFAYSNLIGSFFWSVWWASAFLGTTYVICNCDPEGNCEGQMNGWFVFLFLTSYFWTAQVIKNVVHVTVAGTVGTWWFTPVKASGCCSQGVRDSYIRSITSSFGSICLGSLVVAIISAMKEIIHTMKEQDNSLLFCLAECLMGLIENLVEYFNQWAFVFVGLYGYTFMEAGKNTMALFRSRGWTAIVTDFLVDAVLLVVTFATATLTGGVVSLIAGLSNNINETFLEGTFIVGMLVSFIMCSTLFSLISSAVNTVVVCYAEAPSEFQDNHPALSNQMRAAWRHAYPSEFQY